jgi:hypothetical protein
MAKVTPNDPCTCSGLKFLPEMHVSNHEKRKPEMRRRRIRNRLYRLRPEQGTRVSRSDPTGYECGAPESWMGCQIHLSYWLP